MAELNQEAKDELERLIDRSSLADVVEALAEIAYEKAEHVSSTWQDRALADEWSHAGDVLHKSKQKIDC